jgi:hypothetical protein
MNDKKVHEVIIWYNREWKSWTIQKLDEEGNQIDDCSYTHSKKEAIALRDRLLEELGIVAP